MFCDKSTISLWGSPDPVGNVTNSMVSLDNTSTNNLTTGYSYDAAERLIGLTAKEREKTQNFAYAYNLDNGRISSVTNVESGIVTSSVHDLMDRTANEPLGTDDRWGELWITNLTVGAGVIPSVNGATFTAEIPTIGNGTNTLIAAIGDKAGNVSYATNHVFVSSTDDTDFTDAEFAYNTAGCLTNIVCGTNSIALEWDERYRLTFVKSVQSVDVSYEYDVLGRKVSRTAGVSPAEAEHYVYNGNQIAADLDGSGNLLRSYTWGSGIDNLLAVTLHPASTVVTNSTPLTLYPIKDPIGISGGLNLYAFVKNEKALPWFVPRGTVSADFFGTGYCMHGTQCRRCAVNYHRDFMARFSIA